MQDFNESNLIEELSGLPGSMRVVFAAACAERLMPAYRKFEVQDDQEAPNALERALSAVWDDPSPIRDRERLEQLIEDLMALVPQEESCTQPWTQDMTNAQNAGMSVLYVLRTKLAGDAQEAAWAARVAYEALDNVVINQEKIDTSLPGEEQRVLAHPLLQAEFARQQRDIDELRCSKSEQSVLAARIRDRAKDEASVFFGSQ